MGRRRRGEQLRECPPISGLPVDFTLARTPIPLLRSAEFVLHAEIPSARDRAAWVFCAGKGGGRRPGDTQQNAQAARSRENQAEDRAAWVLCAGKGGGRRPGDTQQNAQAARSRENQAEDRAAWVLCEGKGGGRRPGDSRGAECPGGLIPHHAFLPAALTAPARAAPSVCPRSHQPRQAMLSRQRPLHARCSPAPTALAKCRPGGRSLRWRAPPDPHRTCP